MEPGDFSPFLELSTLRLGQIRSVRGGQVTGQEGQREDLIRTATALVQRVELAIDRFPDLLVVGFRSDGAASLFVGEDPVYQFNAAGELRRAFRAGKLVKAALGKLVELTRGSADNRVDMISRELTDQQHQQFLSELRQTLDQLQEALRQQEYRVTGQVPADQDVVGKVAQWIDQLPSLIPVAQVANAR